MNNISKAFIKTDVKKISTIAIIIMLRSCVLLFPSVLIKYAINHSITNRDWFSLILIGVIVAIVPFFTNYLISIDFKLSSYIFDNSAKIMNKILVINLQEGTQSKGRDRDFLYVITKGISEVGYFYYRDIGNLLWCAGTVLLGMFYIINESLSIFLIMLSIFIFGGILIFFLYKKLIDTEEKRVEKKIELQTLSQNIDALGTDILYNDRLKCLKFDLLYKADNELVVLTRKKTFFQQLIISIIKFISSIIVVTIFYMGILFLGITDIGSLVSIYQVTIWVFPAITLFIQILIRKSEIYAKNNTIESLLIKHNTKKEFVQRIVSFGKNYEIIKGIYGDKILKKNIQLKKSKVYLFEGKVGVGKSTFLIDLVRGQKDIDNVWLSQVSPIIFSDTLENNIKLSKKVTDQKILETLTYFRFPQKIIERLKSNVDFSMISGGERQLIEFARLLIRIHEFDLLIFDESFSAVDSETFQTIWVRFRQRHKDKTILFVSHKKLNGVPYDGRINYDDFFEG